MVHSSIVAAFDFDHTLTDRDSLLPFLYAQSGFFKASFRLSCLIPAFLSFLLGVSTRQKTKEKILMRFFKGMPIGHLQTYAKQYAEKQLDRYLKSQALERLRWHQKQGHRCILVSASIDTYLQPWALRHGFEAVLGSSIALDEKGCVTGRLDGRNCWGPEKVKRLLAYLGPKDSYLLYAYGDSRGDKELLALADYPFYRRFS